MNFVKVDSFTIDKVKRRIIKFLRKGNSDVQTGFEALPAQIDSAPMKDMVAVYAPTEEKGKVAIIGYMNKNQKAEAGEMRLYALDDNSTEKIYLWLKKNGTIELGGTADNAVRYSKMAETINELKDDITTLKNVFTGWTPVPNDGGAALKLAAATWYGTPFTKDIADSKIDEIKTL